MNSVAARTPAQPLYAVFLARVIKIEAVQCHRAAVTDDDYTPRVFFSEGCPPQTLDYSCGPWMRREDFPGAPSPRPLENPISLPMQHAWDAAVAAFKEFIDALNNGELIASGVHPATGVRRDLDPAEWTRTG